MQYKLILLLFILFSGCSINNTNQNIECPINSAILDFSTGVPFAVLPNTIDEWNIDFNTPKCRKGEKEGEYPNHYYCGYNAGIKMAKLSKTELNSNGAIIEKKELFYSVEFDENNEFLSASCKIAK